MLKLQPAVECISQLAEIKRESDCLMKQLERHKEYSEMLICCFCFSLDVLSILWGLCVHSVCVCMRVRVCVYQAPTHLDSLKLSPTRCGHQSGGWHGSSCGYKIQTVKEPVVVILG